jgi:radical SAM superfamily enzyme YgiQ (UPF0313 family)
MKVLIANAPCVIPEADGRERYFVRAGSRWPFSVVKRPQDKISEYVPFPFYIAYSAGILRDRGHDVRAVDAVPLNMRPEQFVQDVVAHGPDVLVLETATPTFESDVKLVREIRSRMGRKGPVVVFTGAHVTTFPQQSLADGTVDYVILGEYERALEALVDAVAAGSKLSDLEKIPGLGYRDGTGSVRTLPRALVHDLDALPFPAWDLMPAWSNYWDNICQVKPAAQMHASRGCPFRCDFCVWIQVMYDNSRRRGFSPSRIVDEMLALERRGIREIYFDDDIFTGDKAHVRALCAEMKKRGTGVRWSAMGDAMICDADLVATMADAGCIGLKFGVESGDPEVLRRIQKPLKLEKVVAMARACARHGIKSHATFSFGLTGETLASMQRTFDFMKVLDIDTLQVSISTPYPGTRMYKEARDRGLIDEVPWSDFDGATSSVVRFENLTRHEVESFANTAATRWLRHKIADPKWVARQFRNTARIIGGQGWDGAFKFVRAGLRVLLERDRTRDRADMRAIHRAAKKKVLQSVV